MKWMMVLAALSLSLMVGCQCTEKADEMDAVPAEEQQQFENMDESASGEMSDEEMPPEEEMGDEGMEEGQDHGHDHGHDDHGHEH